MERHLAAGRRDAAHRAHHRVDAGRQALAGVRTRLAAELEAPDDAGGPQLAQDVAEHHRGDDIAAARIDEHDSAQLLVVRAGLEEVDERLRRIALDHAVGDDDVRAARAAAAVSSGSTRNVIELESANAAAGTEERRKGEDRAERDAAATFAGWWAVTGSNRRPSRCKRDALPTELTALPAIAVYQLRYPP